MDRIRIGLDHAGAGDGKIGGRLPAGSWHPLTRGLLDKIDVVACCVGITFQSWVKTETRVGLDFVTILNRVFQFMVNYGYVCDIAESFQV